MTFISPKKLDRAIDKAMLELMAPLGFVAASSGGIERWQGDRYDYMGCVVNKIGGTTRVSPFGQMGFGHIKRLYSHFMSDDPAASDQIAVDVQLKYAHFVKDWVAHMSCEQVEHLDCFLKELMDFVTGQLYPALMAYSSPEEVLAAYVRKNESDRRSFDPPTWFGVSSALTGLILARLHDPAHYASLKQRYSAQFLDLGHERLERANRLLAYLDLPDPLPALEGMRNAP
jgi:hypothetical protein